MRLPRFTIAGAMVAIAVIAFDGVAARVCLSWESRTVRLVFHQCALMMLAAQVGLYCAYRTRHHYRLFWLGFTASGLVAALSLVTMPPGIADLWRPYFLWEKGLFDRSPEVLRYVVADPALHSLVSVLIYFAPQFVVAIAGGLLTAGIGGIFTRKGPRAPSASVA